MPFVLLHEFFDRRWQDWADRVALDIPPGHARPDRRVATYRDLAHRSQAIGARVRPFIQGECVVAVLLPRATVAAFAAPLGILRAGAAYTAIDVSFPDERVRDVLEDAQAAALVTNEAGAARASRLGFDASRIVVVPHDAVFDEPRSPASTEASAPPWLTAETLAYVIYTSGTTGRPKGVMIEHRAIANLVASDLGEFRLDGHDRAVQHSSHAYDSSIEETWLALAAGATLVVMDDDAVRGGPDLVPWLERERVTMWCPPPTALRATGCRDASRILPRLRLLYVGGEALTDDVVDAWAPGRRLVNGYGPTECAVTVVRGPATAGAAVSIGHPVPGAAAWILDDALRDVPDGEVGELCLGGACLARGYWNAPDLTARKFPVHPRHGRLYRTGDLARRAADGSLVCLGRVDSQVKLRGYRVELEEIESRLASRPGVRAAACRVQTEGARQTLVAFVVPAEALVAPAPDQLRAALAAELPAYMVPAAIQTVDTLPTTTGGKLDRSALPEIQLGAGAATVVVEPRTPTESLVASAAGRVLRHVGAVSVDAHFFNDLGGDSVGAAELIAALREDGTTASLTVRDVYEAPTIGALAARADAAPSPLRADAPAAAANDDRPTSADRRPIVATVVQALWLALELVTASAVAYLVVFQIVPRGILWMGALTFTLALPAFAALAALAYTPVALAVAVAVKRALIGRYTPGQAPVWGSFYVRHWIVQQTTRLVPWRILDGTVLEVVALRALGARIGRRVHLHRGVDLLEGGWDLLDIGDDVTIGQEATIRLVDLVDGQIVIGPVRIGDGATVEVRASVGSDATIEAGGYLTALSSLPTGGLLPANERWDGVPAVPSGASPEAPPVAPRSRVWSPGTYGGVLLVAQMASRSIPLLGLSLVAAWLILQHNVDAAMIVSWLQAPIWNLHLTEAALVLALVPVPVTVVGQAIAARVLGPREPQVMSRWSPAYLRVWMTTDLVAQAGNWLAGTLMWPIWLRAAGMRLAADCEISTIIDVLPRFVEIGTASFLADGIYLAGPRVHRGTVTLARVRIGANAFLGNHVVVPAGCDVPDDVLIGVCTVADDAVLRSGTAWFGHPPFVWSRRRAEGIDRQLTHEPSALRYLNRWLWEAGRFVLPGFSMAAAITWLWLVASSGASPLRVALVVTPAAAVATLAALCLVVLAMKWVLLGRVKPGEHAFWSCWCSRWDFHYMAWDRLARLALERLQGTLLLPWYLRAMGMRIGRGVVLGAGFAQVVDPDMLEIEDGATVHAHFQAHTFEDRVLKIDRIQIRRHATVGHGAVILYGADIGEHAAVAAQSVIMKREHLDAGRRYEGCPSRPSTETIPHQPDRTTSQRATPSPAAIPRLAPVDDTKYG